MNDIEPGNKILVVDDEPINVELITSFLKRDYQIIPAYGGKEGLDKFYSERPDIVLLDIMMPGINGYEVCEKIKQDTTRFTPVVIITALTEIEDKIKSIEAGADDFITKPINTIELITRIRSLLKSKYFYDELVRSKKTIEAQNDLKTILANLLPFLLQVIPAGKKTEVIRHMSKQVEDFIWTNFIHNSPSDLAQTAQISCSILNRLGADFSIEMINERSFTVKNSVCPWGESNSINPVLCMLTNAIFVRTGSRLFNDINADIKKTIANGDGYCLLKIFIHKDDNN